MLGSILSYDIIFILKSYFWRENVRVLLYAKVSFHNVFQTPVNH